MFAEAIRGFSSVFWTKKIDKNAKGLPNFARFMNAQKKLLAKISMWALDPWHQK
jgi:hypothetical protein